VIITGDLPFQQFLTHLVFIDMCIFLDLVYNSSFISICFSPFFRFFMLIKILILTLFFFSEPFLLDTPLPPYKPCMVKRQSFPDLLRLSKVPNPQKSPASESFPYSTLLPVFIVTLPTFKSL